MKLFKVYVERTVMVMARDQDSAEYEAERLTDRGDCGEADICHAVAVDAVEQIPPEWSGCIPFGEEDDRTCEAIVSSASVG